MNVDIMVIPHGNHRKEAGPTVGDWWFDTDWNLHIRISEILDQDGNRDFFKETLIAHHEFTEALLCWAHGIPGAAVDEFDSNFHGEEEPGDDPDAPYYSEHQIATGFERIMANEMQVYWNGYDGSIEEVFRNAAEKRKG